MGDGNYSKVKSFQDHPSNCAVKEAVTDEIKTVEPPEIVAQHNGTPEKKEQIKDSLTIPKVKEMQKEKQKLPPKVLQLTPLEAQLMSTSISSLERTKLVYQ